MKLLWSAPRLESLSNLRLSVSKTYLVILSSMLRGSRIKVGNTTRLRSAPGLNCEMIWESTTWLESAFRLSRGFIYYSYHCLGQARQLSRLPRHPTCIRPQKTCCLLSHSPLAIVHPSSQYSVGKTSLSSSLRKGSRSNILAAEVRRPCPVREPVKETILTVQVV